MKISEFIVEYLVKNCQVDTVFTITGGGAMYLNDAFGKNNLLNCVYMHHEQSAAMACEAFSQINNSLAVCQITTGPGGTNALSGCAGAWIDSKPVLFISGQVESFSRMRIGQRQSGVQEVDIVKIVKPLTKLAIELIDPYLIKYELERLVYIAMDGRMGPVWLDIPLELQNYDIGDPEKLVGFKILEQDSRIPGIEKAKFAKILKKLESSLRPVICIGNGSAKYRQEIQELANKLQIPIVLGWNGKDLLGSDYCLNMGTAGLFGNRSANMIISQADLILGIGYRFSVPQVGYAPHEYIKNKTVISVDIDSSEFSKCTSFIDIGLEADAGNFIKYLVEHYKFSVEKTGWQRWALFLKNYFTEKKPRNSIEVNSFDFTKALGSFLKAGDIVVTDMGTSFTCTHQFLELPTGVRLMTSSGLAAMGFGLPGSIGAAFANKKGATILITGDGGLMFNIQELQTIKTYNLNIKLIVYENNGYLTMKHMQRARFGRLVGSDSTSMLECPDFAKVFNAFGIESMSISTHNDIQKGLDWLLNKNLTTQALIVHLDPWQELVPRVQTQSDENGNLFPATLDSMFPFLDDQVKEYLEVKRNEFIKYEIQ